MVEDGLSRQALAAVRSLGAAGWEVGAGSPTRGVAAASRAVARWHEVPSPEQGVSDFISATRAAVAAGGYEIVLGARDEEVAALCYHREELGAVVPAPAADRVFRAQDKIELSTAAAQAGLATPAIHSDLEATLANWTSGSMVVKPRLGQTLARSLAAGVLPGKAGTSLAGNPDEARRAIDRARAAGHEPILQERTEGHLGAITVLCDDDALVVSCMQQRAELTWPLDGGVSVRARTIPVDEPLLERVQGLVRDLGWFGLAQLQFLNPDDRDPQLIDFNGRIYGSLALARAAGSNLPDAWGRMALGMTWAVARPTPGVRYQWLWADARRATQAKRGGLVRDLAGVARYAPGAAHSVWSAKDPAPALKYTQAQLRQMLRRRLRR